MRDEGYYYFASCVAGFSPGCQNTSITRFFFHFSTSCGGGGGEHLQREYTTSDCGWALAGAEESSKHVKSSFIYPSLIHLSFNKHFCILLLCSWCCAGFGGLQTSKRRHNPHSHGDHNLVQESGISQRIRLSHEASRW